VSGKPGTGHYDKECVETQEQVDYIREITGHTITCEPTIDFKWGDVIAYTQGLGAKQLHTQCSAGHR
jgi:hypothetical protein